MFNKIYNFIVVGYYTKNTIYEEKSKIFINSLKKFNIPYDVQAIKNLGDWWSNTNYKPTFLYEMLKKHKPKSVIYVDCDAEFLHFPELFERLSVDPSVNVGVYIFDRSCYRKSAHGFEVLSGTVFLKNNQTVLELVKRWEMECKNNPRVWDQKSLEKVLNGNYTKIPGEYCKIFDRMEHITDPVIVHYQASREVRKNGLIVKI